MTPRQMANMLKEYGIRSKSIRLSSGITKGFESTQFNDVFSRYLSPSVTSEIIRHTQQTNDHQAYLVADDHSDAATEDPLIYMDCCAVADNCIYEEKIDFESWK